MSGINYAGRAVLVAHQSRDLPVGSILWVKPDNDKVLCKFRISDKTDEAKQAYDLVSDGSLNYLLVSFLVLAESPPTPGELQTNPQWAGAFNVVREWELTELSLCAVPCNPNAHIIEKSMEVDCWEYETKTAPVIPKPTYARKIDLDAVIQKVLRRHDANDIIDRIRGKA